MDDVRDSRYGPSDVGDSRMMWLRSMPSDSDGEMDSARFCDRRA